MRPVALAFAGRIASGKTTLSSTVAQVLGWPRVAFGDYVRSVAAARGLGIEGHVLQELGACLIEEQGWGDFCRSTLAQASAWRAGRPIVIDGIRHAEVLEALRPLVAPADLLVILLKAPDETRLARLRARRNATRDRRRADTHSTEVQLGSTLPPLADLIIDGRRPVNDLVADVLALVQGPTRDSVPAPDNVLSHSRP